LHQAPAVPAYGQAELLPRLPAVHQQLLLALWQSASGHQKLACVKLLLLPLLLLLLLLLSYQQLRLLLGVAGLLLPDDAEVLTAWRVRTALRLVALMLA
jgi:hypothetical protein